jgi:hypothetical protein
VKYSKEMKAQAARNREIFMAQQNSIDAIDSALSLAGEWLRVSFYFLLIGTDPRHVIVDYDVIGDVGPLPMRRASSPIDVIEEDDDAC